MVGRRVGKVASGGIVTVAFCCALLPGARAQETAFYVGAADLAHAEIAVVRRSLVAAGLVGSAKTKDRSETGFKLFAGYRFNTYLAAEAGYAVVGDFNFSSFVAPAGRVSITSMEPKAWSLDAIGHLPLPHGFSLFARAGLIRTETKVNVQGTGTAVVPRRSFKDSGVGYHAGLGVGFDFHKNVGARVEWERYRASDGITDKADVDLLSWGVRVRF
jgi:OmpA-OmpF porin, OOP family